MSERRNNAASGDPLLELLSSVKDAESRKQCRMYADLYRIIIGKGDDLVQNVKESIPTNEEKLQNSDPLHLLELGELLLYRGDIPGYRKVIQSLNNMSLKTLLFVGGDPLFVRNRLAILEAMENGFPESIHQTLELVRKFPRGAEETNEALKNLACTLVECIHISGMEERILPELLAVLKKISRKDLRGDATALVARKLCMRAENTPTTNHGLIEFARNELLPGINDVVERDFTEVQLAIAEMKHSQMANDDRRDEFRSRSENAFSDLEKKLARRISEEQRILLNFNLIRGLVQAGLYERSRALKNKLIRDFERELESTMDTLEMIEETRKRFNGHLPAELREMEQQLVEMTDGTFAVSCGCLILAARFSPDGELASEYLREAQRMLNMIPFMYTRYQLLLQLGGSFSFRHDPSLADQALKYAGDITKAVPRKDGLQLFRGELTDWFGESYFFEPRQSLIDLYTDLAAELRVGRRDLDKCIVNLMASIYSYARSQKWKIAFNE